MATGSELVRLGPDGDGGYLVPNDLVGIEACLSPGVGTICGFESDCASLGMQVFMADGSVSKPADSSDAFHFVQKNLGARRHCDALTIGRWVKQSMPASKGDLLLQMDIEGAEYDVLLDASRRLLRRFRILVVEFHDLHRLAERKFFNRANASFTKILRRHVCVHIHPNNCCGSHLVAGIEVPQIAEFTFLRRDRIVNPEPLSPVTTFPHPLDMNNVAAVEYLPLPAPWFQPNR